MISSMAADFLGTIIATFGLLFLAVVTIDTLYRVTGKLLQIGWRSKDD